MPENEKEACPKWSHTWMQSDFTECHLVIKRGRDIVVTRTGRSEMAAYLDAYSELYEAYETQKARLSAAERENERLKTFVEAMADTSQVNARDPKSFYDIGFAACCMANARMARAALTPPAEGGGE
jgi:hypothetical protein